MPVALALDPKIKLADDSLQNLAKKADSVERDGSIAVLELLLVAVEKLNQFMTPHYTEEELHDFRRAHYEAQRATGSARALLRETSMQSVK